MLSRPIPPSISISTESLRSPTSKRKLLDPFEASGDEFLARESRVDGHYYHVVYIGKHFFHRGQRFGWVKRDAGFFPQLADGLKRGIKKVMECLGMDRDHVGTRVTESFDPPIRVLDLQMDVQRKLGGAPNGLHDQGPKGQIVYEVSVHHVEMKLAGARFFHLGDLIPQSGEIGRENGWCQSHGSDSNAEISAGRRVSARSQAPPLT